MPANERFHTLAYTASANNAALTQLPMVADPMTNTQNSNLVVPDWNLVGAIYGVGANLTQIRLNAPSLQALWLPFMVPFDRNATPQYPPRFVDKSMNPLQFQQNEQLEIDTADDAGVATRKTVFLWLFPRMPTPISSSIRTMRATGSTTLTIATWTNVSLTLAANLPAGTYALVGLAARSAGLLAARVAFVGGTYRPGVIGGTVVGQDSTSYFRLGNLGVFGEFTHNLVPTIDCFSNTADTTEEFELDLVKIA